MVALVTGASMALLRVTLQVRSVPERMMEWLLLFVPLEAFEAGIQRFGFAAKSYALYGAVAVTGTALVAIGAVAVDRRWSIRRITLLGLGLWLLVMLVIMPMTGAGVFALGLIEGTATAVVGYLAVALTFSASIACAGHLWPGRGGARSFRETAPEAPSRRSAFALVGAALASLGGAAAAARWLPNAGLTRVLVLDPQQPYPSGGIQQANPHPNLVSTPLPGASPVPASSTGEPPAARNLSRDKDGAALPSGRRAGQLASAITSNADFYIVTKNAAGDPVINTREWRLRIDGEVQRPVELDYASLRRLPSVEVTKTLECISNFVSKCELAPFGCDLISTARWKGVRVADVLALAGGARPGAVSLATFAADEFTTALPIDLAMDPDTLLAYEMNGETLPREHGYPVRMLVPGRYGMKNAKWIVALRVTNREFLDWYAQRSWSKTAVVKTMSRIDSPAPGAALPPGEHEISGIAYAGDRGIQRVEYSADGGQTWQPASFIDPPIGRDVWARWRGRFTLPARTDLVLMARATDGSGATQPEAFTLPQPDGGSGWCGIVVTSRA